MSSHQKIDYFLDIIQCAAMFIKSRGLSVEDHDL